MESATQGMLEKLQQAIEAEKVAECEAILREHKDKVDVFSTQLWIPDYSKATPLLHLIAYLVGTI